MIGGAFRLPARARSSATPANASSAAAPRAQEGRPLEVGAGARITGGGLGGSATFATTETGFRTAGARWATVAFAAELR
jgi:hypothetical protein